MTQVVTLKETLKRGRFKMMLSKMRLMIAKNHGALKPTNPTRMTTDMDSIMIIMTENIPSPVVGKE